MCRMYENCSSLNNLDVTKFDTKNVTNMNGIFKNCKFNYDKKIFK